MRHRSPESSLDGGRSAAVRSGQSGASRRTHSGEESRRRARDIRDEALARHAERDSLGALRREIAELKAMIQAQGEQIAALVAMLPDLASPSTLPSPSPSTPRPLTGSKRMALERIRDLRRQDLSFSRICEIFQTENIPTLSGEGQWSKGTLWNLWRNHRHQLGDWGDQ